MSRYLFAIIAAFSCLALQAQESERILLPIATPEFQGAHGSFWVTRLTVYNDLDRLVGQNDLVLRTTLFPGGGTSLLPKRAKTFDPIEIQTLMPSWQSGLTIFARKDLADSLHFSLRLRDTTRQSTAYGTDIPVVRERELRTGPIVLSNVPVSDRYRQSLRIYEVDRTSDTCKRVQVRLFDMNSGETLVSREIELTNYQGGPCSVATFLDAQYPNGAQIHLLAQQLLPDRAGREFIGLEVKPLTEGLRYWAFVTIADNETQHASTITPQ